MSKYYINKENLVGFAFNKIMSRVLPSVAGTEESDTNLLVNGLVMKDLGFSYENIKAEMPVINEAQILVQSVIASLETRAEHFMSKCYEVEVRDGYSVESETYRAMLAMEAEEEKEDDNIFETVVTEDNLDEHMENSESGIATLVANLIKEVVKADASEVNDIAEKIVTLSKDEADINKDEDMSEDDVFATSDTDEDDTSDNEDPFKDNSDENSKNDEDGDDNPFASSDKSEDENNDDDNEDNPFEDKSKDDDSKNEDKKETKDNPFENDNDEVDPGSKERAEENANQKLIKELKISTYGLEKLISGSATFNPFAGLENNSLNRYAKFIADGMYSADLHKTYTTHGLESEEFKTVKNKYAMLAKDVHRAAIATVLVGSLLNVPIHVAKLQSPEVFNA